MRHHSKSISRTLTVCFVVVAISLLIFAIWLPFGFGLTGLYEEWWMLGLFSQNKLSFLVHPSDPMGWEIIRVLTIFPHALAYYLDPNSFNMWHWSLILSLFVKGISCAYLVWFLKRSSAWGLFAGILILIYPADVMQLSFRGIHINWAVSFFLMAVALHLYSLEFSKKGWAIFWVLLSGFLYGISLLLYEIALPLFCMPYLMLSIRYGFGSALAVLKGKKTACMIWLGVVFAFLIRALWINLHAETYQAETFSGGGQIDYFQLISKLPGKIYLGLCRGLFAGWIDAFRILVRSWSLWGYAYLLLFALAFSALMWSMRGSRGKIEKQMIARMLWVGVLVTVLGFFLFLPTPGHMYSAQRIYLCSAIGGVIFWIGLFYVANQHYPKTNQIIILLFLMAGLSQQLFQFRHYMQISDRQRYVLKEIVDQYSDQSPRKKILILDKTEQLNRTWLLLKPDLHEALNYFYGHVIQDIDVCYEPSFGWAKAVVGLSGRCEEKSNRWVFHPNPIGKNREKDYSLAKSDIQIIKVEPEDYSKNEVSQRVAQSHNAQMRLKYKNILLRHTWQDQFELLWRQNKNNYHWSVGEYWNMDIPIRGGNWSEAMWQKIGRLFPHVFIWQTGHYSTLHFYFIPKSNTVYHIQGYSKIHKQASGFPISISLNGHPLSIFWKKKYYWEANLSGSELKSGWNLLEFFNSRYSQGSNFGLREIDVFPLQEKSKEH